MPRYLLKERKIFFDGTYVSVTLLVPEPKFPTVESAIVDSRTLKISVCPLVQLPPVRLTVAVVVPDPVTEEIVGAVPQVPLPKLNFEVVTVTAREKVTCIDDGTEENVAPVAGEVLDTVGAVLSTVIKLLSADAVDRLPRASLTTPACTFTFIVPLPEQLESVIVAPDVLIEPTPTVHDGVPEMVDTVIFEDVRVPFITVPPLLEATKVATMVGDDAELMVVADGAARVTVGPVVLIV